MDWGRRDDARRAKERAKRERREREQEERRAERKVGPVIGSIITTAVGIAGATTFTNDDDFLPGHSGTADKNWANYSVQTEQDRRTGDAEDGTTDTANRKDWSSEG